MILLSQPFDTQLGEFLLKSLDSGKFSRLSVVVAFAKNSGVLRLRESMQRFRDSGGELHFFVGLDMNGTSYEALTNLFPVASTLRVVHDENGQTFHTKLFNFVAEDHSVLIVGSHNLTGGGLWTNFESSVQLHLDHENPDHLRMQQDIDAYLRQLQSLTDTTKLIKGESDIQALLANSYVEKEIKEQIERRKSSLSPIPREPLFGSVTRAHLPKLPAAPVGSLKSQPTANLALEKGVELIGRLETRNEAGDPTLWLETRKMTGGSRNILDLSKSSLLNNGNVVGTRYAHQNPEFMRGAIEFFGIDPEDTTREKEITVNFEGTDYFGNTIKFPNGEHANGTWRIQIKGVSAQGVKITTTFKRLSDGGYLLPEKIVTFTRVDDDYYYLSVFSESELPDFISASSITAFNGRTNSAKMLGIL